MIAWPVFCVITVPPCPLTFFFLSRKVEIHNSLLICWFCVVPPGWDMVSKTMGCHYMPLHSPFPAASNCSMCKKLNMHTYPSYVHIWKTALGLPTLLPRCGGMGSICRSYYVKKLCMTHRHPSPGMLGISAPHRWLLDSGNLWMNESLTMSHTPRTQWWKRRLGIQSTYHQSRTYFFTRTQSPELTSSSQIWLTRKAQDLGSSSARPHPVTKVVNIYEERRPFRRAAYKLYSFRESSLRLSGGLFGAAVFWVTHNPVINFNKLSS